MRVGFCDEMNDYKGSGLWFYRLSDPASVGLNLVMHGWKLKHRWMLRWSKGLRRVVAAHHTNPYGYVPYELRDNRVVEKVT